jgi:hypothetical protein
MLANKATLCLNDKRIELKDKLIEKEKISYFDLIELE